MNPTLECKAGRRLAPVSLFGIWLGLTAGNFAYQLLASHQWETAAERSFFQLVAFIAVAICRRIMPNHAIYQPSADKPLEDK